MHVSCNAVHKAYGEQVVVDDVSWELPAGSRWGLLGSSGAGKTTLLRILAGLEEADSGEIAVRLPTRSPIVQPRIGMVFQNLSLWPHLTARQHIECVAQSVARGERSAYIDRLFREVSLPERVWDRRPEQLSGGEAQRLALARALAVEPELLLLDEPLAQVDAVLNDELLSLLRRLALARSLTTIYVTHSWREAQAFADHIAVLMNGRLVQSGNSDDVYRHPVNAEVAELTGPIVRLPKEFINRVVSPVQDSSDRIVVRPQHVSLVEPADHNAWDVVHCRLCGSGWQLVLRSGGEEIEIFSAREYGVKDVVGVMIDAPAEGT